MDVRPRIQWKTLDELETSLREFQRLYAASAEDAVRQRSLREIVIRAKDRARFASRNPKVSAEKRTAKEEMVRWMLVWLDDPSMFVDWVQLRRGQLSRAGPPFEGDESGVRKS
jgi:hypothetical protein